MSGKFNKNEETRLAQLDQIFGWRNKVSIKEYFNKAGKLDALTAAQTEDERKEMAGALRGVLFMSSHEAVLANLYITDIFMRAVRRVAADDDVAPLLPVDKLEQGDAELLEKCKFSSIAAVVRVCVDNNTLE